MKRRNKILIGILIVLVIIQFIRPQRNLGNAAGPNDITHSVAVPDTVMKMLQVSCYDCHSNHTNYPWYAEINPVGWWLSNHVNEGKEELNFSEFTGYSGKRMNRKLHETSEQVKENEMPISSYTLIHADAKLSEEQRKMIIDWAEASRKLIDTTKQ